MLLSFASTMFWQRLITCLAAGVLLGTASCGRSGFFPADPPEPECVQNSDCEPGEQCVSGECVPIDPTTTTHGPTTDPPTTDPTVEPECFVDEDCFRTPLTPICIESSCEQCEENEDCLRQTNGVDTHICLPDRFLCQCVSGCTACMTSADCAPGQFCLEGGCRGGPVCDDDDDCLPAQGCVDEQCVNNVECEVNEQCEAGQVCRGGFCDAGIECRNHRDCRAGFFCRNNGCKRFGA